jgi:hypothetical protein
MKDESTTGPATFTLPEGFTVKDGHEAMRRS